MNQTTSECKPSKTEIAALARRDLTLYATAMWRSFEAPAHIRLIADKLEAVERGEIRRLMLFLPPRHGKSLLSTQFLPAWYLGLHPDRFVISASYGQDLADDIGRIRVPISLPIPNRYLYLAVPWASRFLRSLRCMLPEGQSARNGSTTVGDGVL